MLQLKDQYNKNRKHLVNWIPTIIKLFFQPLIDVQKNIIEYRILNIYYYWSFILKIPQEFEKLKKSSIFINSTEEKTFNLRNSIKYEKIIIFS